MRARLRASTAQALGAAPLSVKVLAGTPKETALSCCWVRLGGTRPTLSKAVIDYADLAILLVACSRYLRICSALSIVGES